MNTETHVSGAGRNEGSERRTPQEVFKELWSQALVAVGQVEEEARRLLDRLSQVVDLNPEELQRHGRDLADRLRSQRHDLEHSVEAGIQRTISRLNIPTRAELSDLEARFDSLSRRLDRVVKARAGQGSKKKTGA